MRKSFFLSAVLLLGLAGCGLPQHAAATQTTIDPQASPAPPLSSEAPAATVKLIFIHHSSGQNWLSSGNGNLGIALNANHYYVTETDYGWDAEPDDNLGDRTDTVNWPEWFTDAKMPSVYGNDFMATYSNSIADPPGENEIVMFKSCFPNSEVGSDIADEQAIYTGLLPYFANHPEKLFVLVTPPGETEVSSYALTKTLCDWLADEQNGWLKGYSHGNVAVFDFYCTLSETDSHHRFVDGAVQRVYSSAYDGISPYHDGDDHPNSTGNQKATNEFLPWLNVMYNKWKASR